MVLEAAGMSLRQRRKSGSGGNDGGAALAATAADALLDTAKQVSTKLEGAALLLWDELEPWRRDNAYILGGYRSTSGSYAGSFASLGRLHNETVNIWSHLLGAVIFGVAGEFLRRAVAPRYASATEADVAAFACFFGGALLCLGMSAAYHALSNHSEAVARWGNKLDYSGIVFLIVGSYVPTLYYGFYCLPRLMEFYLCMICLFGLGCLAVSWFEHFRSPAWRPYRALMFVALGLSGVVPVLHGMTIYPFRELHERMGLGWVLLQGVLYIFGAFLYAIRWPERQYPGIFDIWGSSHQIFHVFVLLAAASHLYGMCRAFDFHHGIDAAKC